MRTPRSDPTPSGDSDMDLEAVWRVLTTTRSVRRKLDLERRVEPEVLLACIDVATQAPTGASRESWRFLVVTDDARKRALGALYRKAFDALVAEYGAAAPARPGYRRLADTLGRMPALILVCAEGEPGLGPARQVGFYGSILPAAWSLMLALRARGLGSTWTSLHLREAAAAARVLGIPPGVTQTVLLPVAYTKGARLRPAARKPAREVTFWDAWGRREPG